MKRIAVILAVCAMFLFGIGNASAAMKMHTVTKTVTSGPYRLMLVIGPAQTMSMHGMSGERMIGGKMATCHMGSMSSSMKMGSDCNRHVELHVYNAKTGRVLTKAHVTIRLVDNAKHMTIAVPIMTMEGAQLGTRDLHYGNNVYAGAGAYTVRITVNGRHAVLHVQLM